LITKPIFYDHKSPYQFLSVRDAFAKGDTFDIPCNYHGDSNLRAFGSYGRWFAVKKYSVQEGRSIADTRHHNVSNR
jgi:hypothetical protein